eukprot:Opistho-2@4727
MELPSSRRKSFSSCFVADGLAFDVVDSSFRRVQMRNGRRPRMRTVVSSMMRQNWTGKEWLFPVFIIVAFAVMAGVCEGGRTGRLASSSFRVAVFGTGNINQTLGQITPFGALGYAGCQRALTEQGVPAGNCVYLSMPLSTTVEDLRPAIVSGLYSHFVTLGFQFAGTASDAARAYPNTTWTCVDTPTPAGITNVQGVIFSEDEAGFLAGVTAGLFTANKTLGVIAGVPFAAVKKFSNGFFLGARSTCPSCVVHLDYVPSFVDEELALNASVRMAARGVDVVFGVGGHMSSFAIFDAAARGLYVIGVDTDEKLTTFYNQSDPRAQRLITSAEKRVDIGVYFSVLDVLTGTFKAVDRLVDTSVGGVQVSPCSSTTTCNRLLQTTSVSQLDAQTGCLQTVERPRREIIEEYVSRLASRNVVSGVDSSGNFNALRTAADDAWLDLSVFGLPPPRLLGHSAVVGGGSSIVVFGGEDATSGTSVSTSYVLNYDLPQWSALKVAGASPPARKYHCAVVVDGFMYVFGGSMTVAGVDPTILLDAWRIAVPSGGAWVQLPSMPIAREGHTCAHIGSTVYLFGGRTASGEYRSDVLRYMIDTHEWSTFALESEARPLAMIGSAMVAVNTTHLLLHGGKSITVSSRALWALNVPKSTWTLLSPAADSTTLVAQELYRHAAVKVDSDRVLVTGGVGVSGSSPASYVYSIRRNEWIVVPRSFMLSEALQSFGLVVFRQTDNPIACVYPDLMDAFIVPLCIPDTRPIVLAIGGAGGASSSYSGVRALFVGVDKTLSNTTSTIQIAPCDLLETKGRGILRDLSRAVHDSVGGVAFFIIIAILLAAQFNVIPPYVLYRLWRLGYGHYGNTVPENKRLFMRPILLNWLQIGMIVIEGVQISQLVLAVEIDFGVANTLWSITSAAGLSFSFEWYYWLMFTGAFLWTTYAVCVLTRADVAISRNKIGRILMFPSTYLLPVLSTVGYMPILTTLLASYRCSYIDEGGFMETAGMCTVRCWSGMHWTYAVCSLVVLVFWPLALYTAPLWQDLLDTLDVRYTRNFHVLEAWIKISMVVSRVFLWNVPWAHLSIMAVLSLLSVMYIVKFRPCGLDWINPLRAVAFAVGTYTAVAAMGRTIEGGDGSGLWLVIVLPCGWAALVFGTVLHISTRYKVLIRDDEDMHAQRTSRLRDLLQTINDYSGVKVTPNKRNLKGSNRVESIDPSDGVVGAHGLTNDAHAMVDLVAATGEHTSSPVKPMTLLSIPKAHVEATPASLISKFAQQGILIASDEAFLLGLVAAENAAVMSLFTISRGDESLFLELIASMLIAMFAYKDYGAAALTSGSMRSALDCYRLSIARASISTLEAHNNSSSDGAVNENAWTVGGDGMPLGTMSLPCTVEEQ